MNSDFLFRGVKTTFLNKLEIVNNYSPVFSVLSFADKPFFPENIAPLVKGPEHLDGGDFSLHSVFFTLWVFSCIRLTKRCSGSFLTAAVDEIKKHKIIMDTMDLFILARLEALTTLS